MFACARAHANGFVHVLCKPYMKTHVKLFVCDSDGCISHCSRCFMF